MDRPATVCNAEANPRTRIAPIIRAAIYGRYSSENKREASIEDQDRNCARRRASRAGERRPLTTDDPTQP